MLVNVNGIKLDLDENRKGIDYDLIKNEIIEHKKELNNAYEERKKPYCLSSNSAF